MKVPDDSVLDKVLQWLKYAKEDLRLAEHSLTMNPCPTRLAAYHAQQCAEKMLKAYLVFREVDFPFTHRIARLLELCGDETWVRSLEQAEALTPYAVTLRYPGIEAEVTLTEAKQAIDIARLVRQQVRFALEHQGMNLPDD